MPNIEPDLEQMQKLYDMILAFLVNYSFQLLGAVLVFIIGLVITSKLSDSVMKICERKGFDVTLSRFIANIVKIMLLLMVGVMCLNLLGISVTPLVAAIGAASLGAGLAIQGLLSNYGAGFNIILTRPFVVGDTIRVQGVSGQVKDILLAHTILKNEDGVIITIPNKHIVGEIIHNSKELSIVELEVGVAYGSDLEKVLSIVNDTIAAENEVSKEPAPQVGIDCFADSGVNIGVRAWVPTAKINELRYALNMRIWKCLKENNVEIPFPQHEVRMLNPV